MNDKMTTEQIIQLPISELHPFPNHPFKVLDDERMNETMESIRAYGVLMPVIVRPLESGGYEIISGHRRKRACELAGSESIPAIVRSMTDDEAAILMADSNLQRENILPSERAFAYKMKLDALKHQGRPRLSISDQLGQKSAWSVERVANEAGESKSQIQRFIRLTHLIPQMLSMVDSKQLAFNPAVELSYLPPEEQELLLGAFERAQCSPSLSQAQRMRRLSREGQLTSDAMDAIMSEDKKLPLDRIAFDRSTFEAFFPSSYTPEQMEQTILRLLAGWQKKRQREMER